ncbi:MAG: M15 family metallopeptidase [Flavobacteriales bacterium]
MRFSICFILVVSILAYACGGEKEPTNERSVVERDSTDVKEAMVHHDTCSLEQAMLRAGLIALEDSVKEITTDLRYSTRKNFMQMDLYGCLKKTYALPAVADRLRKAQAYLDKKYKGLKLLVFDCARPLRVQQAMWDSVQMPVYKKIKFLSNPAMGSLHNYGAAVDLSLIDSLGNELDMGTAYDDTSHVAWPVEEALWLEKGKLTKQQIQNRQVLRNAMYSHGFFGIQSEWWHFNFCTREAAIAAGYVQVK